MLHDEPLIRLSRVEHYLLSRCEVGGSRRPIDSMRDEHVLPTGAVGAGVMDIEADELILEFRNLVEQVFARLYAVADR
ncbi:hypothetical protein GCM10023322_08630 [Rugosimonospora acidiphila]|uniref:Uncharacterized protein n=1 Tax=Rugosimonospora acidiphila TaxID=556531 RepID=A0ABP9RKU4_9ACTN